MKKSLLFLVSMMMGAAAFAQSFTATWPQPEAPKFKDFAVEDTLYLWNVGAGGFYTNYQGDAPNYPAPYYGTRASVCDTLGAKMIFTHDNPAGTDESAQWADSPEAYLLVSWVTKFSEFRCTFSDGWNGVWTDNNGNSERYFNIVKSGNYIKVQPDPELQTGKVAGMYLGLRATDADKIVYLYDTTTEGAISAEETFYDEWAAVSPEEYQKYYELVTSEEGQEMMAKYAAAQKLRAQIEGAQAKGIAAADLADEYAVYNNLSSTVEELNDAATAAYDKGRWVEIAEYFEDIVQGEKNDVSGVFVNPDFADGTANGWDITYTGNSTAATNIGYQYSAGTHDVQTPEGTKKGYDNGEVWISGFIEAWKDNNSPNYLGDGSITQTIPGLPAGKYMLAVDAIVTNQGRISDASNPNNYPDDVELYAQASLDGKTYSTPMYTRDGYPEHFEFTFIHTGGSMTLGLRVIGSAEAKMPANWMCMDNLKLYYYGKVEDDPAKVMLDAEIEKALAAHPLEDLDEVVATVSYKNAFKQTIADAQAATADYEDWQDKVKAAQADLEEAIAAYEKFAKKGGDDGEWETKVAARTTIIEEFGEPADEWLELADFVGNQEVPEGGVYPSTLPVDVLADMLLTPAEIEEYISTVDSLYIVAYGKSLKPGMDCSDLLVNASFAEGFTGWTNNSGAGTLGGLKAYPCVERYGGKVDVFQVVKNVPDGVYTLRCQAFERPGGNGSYDGTEAAKVFLYMNNYTTPVQNILASAMPEEEAEDYVNCFISGGNPTEDFYSTGGTTNKDYLAPGFGYVPDGMSGASYAFRAGRYWQEAKGYISGGEMKIGLTSNDVDAHWVLWAQFQLTYNGQDPEEVKKMLDATIETLSTYLENNSEENMTTPAAEATQDVIDAAEKVSETGDSDEMLAEIEKVNAALEAAQENAATLAEFKTAADDLYAAMEDTDHSAAGEDAFNEIADDVDSGYSTMTTEELKALIAKMKEATILLNTPDFSNASDEHPVEFTKRIVNNSFETGTLDGWTTKAGNDTNVYPNTNDTYTIDLIDGDYLFNTWSNSAVEGGLSLSQNIGILPAGTYKLTAVIASFPGHIVKFGVNDEDMDIVIEKAKTEATEVEFIFKLEEEGEVTIKTSTVTSGEEAENKTETFFKADNFRLTYYGANSAKELTPTAIDGIEAGRVIMTNGKYLENGRIVIIKNGVKYNVAGQMIK